MNEPQDLVSLGKSQNVKISDLLLDDRNPRLPPSQQGLDQESLAVVIEMGFDAFTVAESISRHGFFSSEPLIVIPSDTEGKYVAVEGNRRLTALMGLTQSEIRSAFANPDRWDELASKASFDSSAAVPVVVAPNREVCTPVIGYRHISGIMQWKTFAQARYVAALIDDSGYDYDEVHKLIGIEKREVANLYRAQAIADQALRLGIDTGGLETGFSVLQVAMNSTKIRDFVGAPLGSRLEPGSPPIPEGKIEELKELFGYIYGNGEKEPVISDSRQMSQLGNVIASPEGLRALRAGESLDLAKQKVADSQIDPKDRITKRLQTAINCLTAASEDMPQFYEDAEVGRLLDDINAALRDLEPLTA